MNSSPVAPSLGVDDAATVGLLPFGSVEPPVDSFAIGPNDEPAYLEAAQAARVAHSVTVHGRAVRADELAYMRR
jgi:hypothetical protein